MDCFGLANVTTRECIVESQAVERGSEIINALSLAYISRDLYKSEMGTRGTVKGLLLMAVLPEAEPSRTDAGKGSRDVKRTRTGIGLLLLVLARRYG